MVAKLKCLLTKANLHKIRVCLFWFLLPREKVCSFSCAFLLVLMCIVLLYILIKILSINNIGVAWGRGQGARPPPPPPNRNASNDKFVIKTAILSSFSWFVFTVTRDREAEL